MVIPEVAHNAGALSIEEQSIWLGIGGRTAECLQRQQGAVLSRLLQHQRESWIRPGFIAHRQPFVQPIWDLVAPSSSSLAYDIMRYLVRDLFL